MSATRRIRLWGPVALYTGLIFWLSSASRLIPGQQYLSQMDKVCHVAEYAPYAALWMRAIRRSFTQLSWKRAMLFAWVVVAVVGALDEFYQSFVPLKSCDVLDWTADLLGAAMGLWLYRCLPIGRAGS